MKRILKWSVNFSVVAVLSLTLLRAAVPNDEEIFKVITSPTSGNYYPELMLRFEMGDSTLTFTNYHYLYYGFAYDEAYKPLATNPHMDRLLLLASGLDIDSPHTEVLRDITRVGHDALKSDPFNLKVWNLLAYAYGALGDKERERDAYRRVEMILAVIKSSGSGLKEGEAQHILMFDHALDLMAAENLTHRKAMVVSRTVEYIPLVAPRVVDGKRLKGFFFDFSRVYWNKPDSVVYRRERTWQFNNLKPREYKK